MPTTAAQSSQTNTPMDDDDLRVHVARLERDLNRLKHDEARFRHFCDQSPLRMGIVELLDDDADDLRLVWVNRAFLNFHRKTFEEVVGKLGREIGTTPESRRPWLEAYWRAWKIQQPVTVEIFQPQHESWIQATLNPLHEHGSSAKRLAFVITNITQRKNAEASLRQSEQRFRMLFDNSPDAIFVEDPNGFVRDANPAACRLHGMPRDELVGKHVLELVPPQTRDAVRDDFARLKAGVRRTLESSSLRADGSVVPIELTCSPINYGGEHCLLLNVRDITERQSAEAATRNSEALERKLLEAQKLESLGVLAGGVAHDFNNMLAIIMGNASILDRSLPRDSPWRASLEPIIRTAEKAAELCNQMLAYSGRSKFIVEPIDVNRIVTEMIGLLQHSVPKKVELRSRLAATLPLVEADGTQLRQIVMNLIINAGEAIGDNPGTIDVATTSISGADNQRHVILEVADSGAGMDEATRLKIFDPFFTTKFTGRGLGLAMVQGIVRGHKGTISVDSSPGQGSRFRITLPAASAAAASMQAVAKPPSSAKAQLRGKVLIVDDEPGIRQVMSRMLKSLGFQATVASDGEEGLERFKEAPDSFVLVFLDLTMPRLDGQETFRMLHLLKPDLPVILMSGYSEQEAAGKFVGQNVAGFITKPFTVRRLEEKIHAALQL